MYVVFGVIATGFDARYLYTKYFSSLEDVLEFALDRGDPKPACDTIDRKLSESQLSAEQQFLVAHSTRSYYGSTQLLDVGGEPIWVVNEGEYCMLNTLDLSVDQMFWELDLNPWVVRNILDQFVRHYSYVDELKTRDGQIRPGGISFCHDMGAYNTFSPRGYSSYELPNLDALCFSYMTSEQLCNWILIASTYVRHTGDVNWARQNDAVLSACLESLRNRCGGTGLVAFDSTRCETGSEITTYDSLDHSLASARDSLYMAVKAWASAVGLAALFCQLGHPDKAKEAHALAKQSVTALASVSEGDGILPAVLDRASSGYRSRILPACEGLLYPYLWGIDLAKDWTDLYELIRNHVVALLKDRDCRNLFPDGGIRLSSTSSNSWMSKIALFQELARGLFDLHGDPDLAALLDRADCAHVRWQIEGSGYWACSDQFVDGVAKGSRYYPRIITTALWLSTHFRKSAAPCQAQVTAV